MPVLKAVPAPLTKDALEQRLIASDDAINRRIEEGAKNGYVRSEPVSALMKEKYEKYCHWSTASHAVTFAVETIDEMVVVTGVPYLIEEKTMLLKPYSIDGGKWSSDTLKIPLNTIFTHKLVHLKAQLSRVLHPDTIDYSTTAHYTA